MDSGAEIVIQLLPDKAPITVENFKKLVANKFYDGLIFHRVIDGFMIQGGDPEGTGMGGAEEKIKGEFESNGVSNDLQHGRGVVSMARSSDPNSASSQFFICQADSFFLDGDYAAFGQVLSGMDEVDRIANLPKDSSDRPENPPVMEEVYFIEEPQQ
ncbi:MAG: peptidylprolyl isomerase [Eubacteriales bacterium]|nr:peptidylprolyl isomerase [Eubacteriales bacterium]